MLVLSAGKPQPPSGRIRVRRVTSDSVMIEWNAPLDDGGRRILKYIVDYRDVDRCVATRHDTGSRHATFQQRIWLHDALNLTEVEDVKNKSVRSGDVSVEVLHHWYDLTAHLARSTHMLNLTEVKVPNIPGSCSSVDVPACVSLLNTCLCGQEYKIPQFLCSLYWQRATTTDTYTKSCHVTGLKEGREYLFRVIAVNELGESEGLESDLAVRPIRVQGE